MKIRNILRGFVIYFPVTLIVSAVVSCLYGLVAHGRGSPDWEVSFRFALLLGIVLPVAGELERRKK